MNTSNTLSETQDTVVLAVDDSPDALAMINDALEQAGFTVLIALEGKQALNIANKITPDIILLDAIMPQLDGFETCARLKSNTKLSDIPVIFMTGLADTDNIVRGLEAGGVDYLTKPINPDELIARMRVHLANAQLTNSAHSALDTAGQHLFTINEQAHILWATPQTRALFANAQVDDAWLNHILSQQLLQWLSHKPDIGQTLHLQNTDYPLSVRLIENGQKQEKLFKLLDGMAPTGAAKLLTQLPLTERESNVLYWIADGKTNREIGQILEMSPRTVNKHLEQIFKKLKVDNRTSAAAIAIRVLELDS